MSQFPLDRDPELEAFAEALRPTQEVSGLIQEFARMSDFGSCMMPLLMSLGYRGDLRHVAEALPHFAETLDLTGLRNMMANLSYRSRQGRIDAAEVDARLMPCLFVPDLSGTMVLLKRTKDAIIVFNGELSRLEKLPIRSLKGMAYFFDPIDIEELVSEQKRLGWFRTVSQRFRKLIIYVMVVTFFITLLQVATPMFVMSVYDKVVGSRSITTLMGLLAGIGAVMLFDWLLRKIRIQMLMYIGARLDGIVSNAIFMRILSLPPHVTERAPIGAQVSRIKNFDSVRDFFTGPLMMVFFELPFTIIFFVVIMSLAGPVALIPLVTMALFVILWIVMMPMVTNQEAKSRRAVSKRQEFVVEALAKIRGIKYNGVEQIWQDRYRDLAAKAAMATFNTSLITALVNTISTVLVMGSGIATIGTGVFRVLDGEMTTGGLVATMILVWRVLAPIQSAFVAMTRLEQVRSSIGQIDGLMKVTPEREEFAVIDPLKKFKGMVSFIRVSIRYSPDAEPALMGVSFDIKPGEIVTVIGGNGSGKSTIVKLIAGIYVPQAGSIRIDGLDIRQMNQIELRHALAYVPQTCALFYGTIAQNLRLAYATASDQELEEACEAAGVLDEIKALPQGFWTRVGDQKATSLPSSMIQKISLARAYLKPAKIMLFDEPANTLDWDSDQQFVKYIKSQRGKKTIFIVTHRPSHIKIADTVLFFQQGYLKLAGPPEKIIPQIPPGMS
ncbi:MAG: ATP-binding cassette domain-containing protein [Magnetococcales bacterium]|nr:ATP-binding cassette domain-containing protein [Magnetococcales bacterium]